MLTSDGFGFIHDPGLAAALSTSSCMAAAATRRTLECLY
jgi:hypothetical protein